MSEAAEPPAWRAAAPEPGAPAGRARYVELPAGAHGADVAAAEAFVLERLGARTFDPAAGRILIGGERYILVRAASLSVHFADAVRGLRPELEGEEGAAVAGSVLYDLAHSLGRADGRELLVGAEGLDEAARRTVGPIHFAHTGWARVRLLEVPALDAEPSYVYEHPHSFEADAWREAGRERAARPVCAMNAGYSAGWATACLGVELAAVEVLCQARGDASCRFLMAPVARLPERLARYRAAHPDLPLADVVPPPPREAYLARLGQAQAALAASRERYRTLFEDTHDAVLVTGSGGELIEANAAARQLVGLVTDAPTTGLEGHLLEPSHAQLVQGVEREGAYRGEVRLRRSDGEVRVGLATVVAGRDPDGRLRELRWILHDITERLRYEERLRERQRLEGLGSLAAGVAHDFNNLLAAILSSADLLERRLGHGPEAAEDEDQPLRAAVETIRSTALRGRDLTGRLLSYGRGGRYEVRPVSLNDVVETVASLLGPTLEPRHRLALRLKARLPRIEADQGQVENAILNVCLNSRDAMPGGGVIEISTGRVAAASLEELDDTPRASSEWFAVVRVTDTGCGMSPEVLRRAREPFFTTKARGHGTGLGLAMVEGVVRNHRGFMHLASREDQGTTVQLFFPAADEPAPAPEHETRSGPRPGPEAAPGPWRVLVVDDAEHVATSTARLLETMGHAVSTAGSGEEALARLEGEGPPPDVVLLDLVLPGIDGHETLRRMRALHPGLPVVVVSGYGRERVVQELLEEGATFLEKPFLCDELVRKLRQVLR